MAAPLYSEDEIELLLRMKKRILAEGWKPLAPAHKKEEGRRENAFEEVARMKAEPFDGSAGYAFEIDVCHNLREDSISITLFASIHPRPNTAICRYDIHDVSHRNPPWFSPRNIPCGKAHKHVYNERAIREGDLIKWCACASVIRFPKGGSALSQRERLKRKFIDDLNMWFDERDTQQLFIKFPK